MVPSGSHLAHLLLQKGPCPINLPTLAGWLLSYPDREAARYLQEGCVFGFRIPVQGLRAAAVASNLKSVKGMEVVVTERIKKEVSEVWVAGSFHKPLVPNLRVSPLGVVPEKVPGEFRLVHHLSYPAGESVNDTNPQELCSLLYFI